MRGVSEVVELETEWSFDIEPHDRALTIRERQVVILASAGLSNKQIGRRLNLTEGTVKIHLHHVYHKVGVSNRTALTALAIAQGWRGTVKVAPAILR